MSLKPIIHESGINNFSIDKLPMFFLIIIVILVLSMIVYIKKYIKDRDQLGKYYVSTLFFALISCGLVFIRDMISIYLLMEVLSVSVIYFKVFIKGDKLNIKLEKVYIYYQIIGSVLIFISIGLLLYINKSIGIDEISNIYMIKKDYSILEKLVFVSVILGYGIKIFTMIFKLYKYKGRNLLHSVYNFLLINIICSVGLFLSMNFSINIFYLGSNIALGNAILCISVTLLIYSSLKMLVEKNINKILSLIFFTQIEFVFLVLGMSMISEKEISIMSLVAAMYLILNLFIIRSLLIIVSADIINSSNTINIRSMSGLSKKIPVDMMIFIFGLLSLCGLPLFGGYASRLIIYDIGMMTNNDSITIISLIAVISLLIVSVKLIGAIFFGPTDIVDKQHSQEVDRGKILLAVITTIVIIFEILSKFIIDNYFDKIVAAIIEPTEYVLQVIGEKHENIFTTAVNSEVKVLIIFMLLFIITIVTFLVKGNNAGEEIKEGQDTVFDLSIFKKYKDELKFNQKKSQARFVEGCKYDVFIGGEEGDKIKVNYNDMSYKLKKVIPKLYKEVKLPFVKFININKLNLFSCFFVIGMFLVVIYLIIYI